MTLADAAARARIRDDLDTTFVVEAAAGTGKTSELIARIVSVVRSGRAALERIVAVTFTEKAAGEMKLRLRAALGQARDEATDSVQSAHLERALAALELAHINTIHGFCTDLLRERPLEAEVDPAFVVLDESAADGLLQQAFDGWFQRVLDDPPEGVRRALRRRSWRSERLGPREQLLRACRELVEHRDFAAPWSIPDYDRKGYIDLLVQGVRELGQLVEQAKDARDYLARALLQLRDFSERIVARERTRARDHDELEAELVELARDRLWKWQGSGRLFGEQLERKSVQQQRDLLHQALSAFVTQAEADLAARLQRELSEVVAAREQLKNKAGVLDFVDLLLCTRNLLRDKREVRRELQARFSHVFVDEFQDTDPLQADIVLLLTAAGEIDGAADLDPQRLAPVPGKLFVVGDPKQSIYRFRRADVLFYERVKRQLLAVGAELLHLSSSFRSVPGIQVSVNVAFSRLMTGAEDGSQAAYVPLAPYRAPLAEQPAVIALPVPEPYRDQRLAKVAIEESFPDAAAAFVRWLLQESGYRVEEAGRLVPVEAHHVCLLFRRFQSFGQDLTRGYVRGLEARRVPHVLLGGRSLHGREEVIAMRAALAAIEWPDDELAVYATLRGPFFAITDDELLCFRSTAARLDPLRPLEPELTQAHPVITDALAILRRLHRVRNRRPIADSVGQLLAETRAHAGLAIWPTGEQALANVLGVVDAARVFEGRGATSFRAFVDWLDEQAERDEGSETPIIEEGTEGVRLMTIHRAKGLEFPIVVLCDPTAPSTPASASRYIDPARGMWAHRLCGCRPQELLDHDREMLRHDAAESVRLAYVAATRARDLLVVPVFGDGHALAEPGLGWVDALAPALYPSEATRRAPRKAAGCPEFGDDSVRKRPARVQATPLDSVAPGLHTGFGGGEVVWWDPQILELGAQPLGGVRQQELLTETPRSQAWLAAHQAWVERSQQTRAQASVPTLIARSVTELAAAHTTPDASALIAAAAERLPLTASDLSLPVARPMIAIEHTTAQRASRPRGKRFGSLVHAILALVPLDADQPLIQGIAESQARLVAATAAELSAAVSAVGAALTHDVLRRAAAALELRREVPVAHVHADGTIVEGIIDLAFREPRGWLIVDFKTDAELRDPTRYVEQVRLYVEAVRAATDQPAEGLLLAV